MIVIAPFNNFPDFPEDILVVLEKLLPVQLLYLFFDLFYGQRHVLDGFSNLALVGLYSVEVVLAEERLAAYVAHDFVEHRTALDDFVDVAAIAVYLLHLFEIHVKRELFVR